MGIATATPIITFTGGTETTAYPNSMDGYNFFTTDNPLQITSLGHWDSGGDGLNESHQVGIWNANGTTLLTSTILPAGVVGTLDSGFRFVSIEPIVLSANTEFLIGSYTGSRGDPTIRFTTATTSSEIILGSTRYDTSGFFTAPLGTQGVGFDDGYFGPNMNGNAAPIPEPATMLLLGTGLVGVAGAARRRKKNQV